MNEKENNHSTGNSLSENQDMPRDDDRQIEINYSIDQTPRMNVNGEMNKSETPSDSYEVLLKRFSEIKLKTVLIVLSAIWIFFFAWVYYLNNTKSEDSFTGIAVIFFGIYLFMSSLIFTSLVKFLKLFYKIIGNRKLGSRMSGFILLLTATTLGTLLSIGLFILKAVS